MRSCGASGMQMCGGDCSYGACGDQMCSGPTSQACGNCGMQTRTCDASTGQWSEWSECGGQGECAPGDSRECGSGGTQQCGSTCRWETNKCSGQQCSGPTTQRCEHCGQQTRVCDPNTGQFSAWSACRSSGVCEPGAMQQCGDGMQGCTAACQWSACTCSAGLTLCADGSCANLRSDDRCGTTCANARTCTDYQQCSQGRCVCRAGFTTCPGNACCGTGFVCAGPGECALAD
jgi:hypothetical protein